MNQYTVRILRAVAGGLAIIILAFTVFRWMGEYRTASVNTPPAITTQTPEPTKAAEKSPEKADAEKASSKSPDEPKQKQKVVVLIDGLNFRSKPDGNAEPIRGLNKGTQLTLLKKQDGWYQVQDEDGVKGWVSSKSSYTKIK